MQRHGLNNNKHQYLTIETYPFLYIKASKSISFLRLFAFSEKLSSNKNSLHHDYCYLNYKQIGKVFLLNVSYFLMIIFRPFIYFLV